MFYRPECGLSWWMFQVSFRIMCVLLLLDEIIRRCELYLLSDGVVEFSYVLTYFLLAGSVHFWWRGVKISNFGSGFIYFSLEFYQFCPTYVDAVLFGAHTLRIVVSSWKLTPFSLCSALLYPQQLFLLWSLVCQKLI